MNRTTWIALLKIIGCVYFIIFPSVNLFAVDSVASIKPDFYLGLRSGYSYNENSCTNSAFNCDHTDVGYGVFAGYPFNQSVAVELSFNDLGDSTAEYLNLRLKGKSRETDLALKLSHNFSESLQLYAKLGAAYWEGKVIGRDPILEDNHVRLLMGTGVEFSMSSHWSARVEYQYIDQVGNNERGLRILIWWELL